MGAAADGHVGVSIVKGAPTRVPGVGGLIPPHTAGVVEKEAVAIVNVAEFHLCCFVVGWKGQER